MFNQTMLVLSITAALCGSAFAQSEFRQHDAHVHGHVELNIAQDGHDLLVEITAPGADVTGFEHAPQSDSEIRLLNQALENLNQADSLFTLSEAGLCSLQHADVGHNLGDHQPHHDDEHHDHDDHASHDDPHHADDDADHAHHSEHGAFTIQYQYHCEQISDLKQIETHWFDLFPSTREMQVNLLTDNRQTATELTPQQTVISL
ncbi:DUF2796 domain-containing protein [Vibrio sp. ABG19]|uniref:zinc uptake protein ZrgA n=1 Tax=Vibrio sp. ABG19 TaxID=2817385 RepID=UPI00249EE46A|nr:DUF2796 domain-containing protein [Vibrio sp. ABG19]WGY47983.1 DUF2796 domain-containing protein [Vibrio sp. ABG19]